MGWERWFRRAVGSIVSLVVLAPVSAQHDPLKNPPLPPSSPPVRSTAEAKRGTADAPTHAPQPTLHPLVALQHCKNGNTAATAAIARGQPLPQPAARPAGGGRWLAAVLVCADADVDIAPLLGLRRSDVLLVSVPGPFASPETTALLERAVTDERLSLVLVLAHADCRALAERNTPDALQRRRDALRVEAARLQQPQPKTLAQLQREQLLAASELLRGKQAAEALRIVPATLETRTGVLQWHHTNADVMPLAPVK